MYIEKCRCRSVPPPQQMLKKKKNAFVLQPDDTMTIIGMYDTVPLIHEAKKSGATLMEFLRGVGHENVFASRSNVLLLGAELSDLGLAGGETIASSFFTGGSFTPRRS